MVQAVSGKIFLYGQSFREPIITLCEVLHCGDIRYSIKAPGQESRACLIQASFLAFRRSSAIVHHEYIRK